MQEMQDDTGDIILRLPFDATIPSGNSARNRGKWIVDDHGIMVYR